jgi:hypothetical protein
MVGPPPLVVLIPVTVAAGVAARKGGWLLTPVVDGRPSGTILDHINRDRDNDNQGCNDAGYFPAGHGVGLIRMRCLQVGEIATIGKSYRLMSKKTTSKMLVFETKKLT